MYQRGGMRDYKLSYKNVRARNSVALISILILVMKVTVLLSLLPSNSFSQGGHQTKESKRADIVGSNDNVQVEAGPTRRYALIIGVDKYQEVGNLTGAVNDAELLADTLVNYAGFPKDHVVLLTSKQPKELQPTRPNILEKLSLIREQIPKDGNALLLVAFAGHGMERIQGKSYLVPSDAKTRDPQLLEDTAIGTEFLKQRILETGVKQVILILDSCRNTPQGKRFAEDTLLPESIPDEVNLSNKNQNINVFVTLFATSPNKSAYEDQNSKPTHGYYTLALVEALKGKAANEKREVTVSNLIAYLEKEVPKRVKKDYDDAEQNPHKEIYGGQRAGELVLSEADPIFDPELLLTEGKNIEGKLNGEDERVFQMPLEANRLLYFEFRAQGIDAFVSFESPDKKELGNSVFVSNSPEPATIFLVTPKSGIYRLKLKAPKTQASGTYIVKFVTYRQSNPGDEKRIIAKKAFGEAEKLAFATINKENSGHRDLSIRCLQKFEQVIALWNEARKLQPEKQDYEGEIKALRRMAEIYLTLDDEDKSLKAYNNALLLYRSLEDKNGEAVMHILISQIYLRKGDSQKALASLNQSTDILQLNHQPLEFEKRARATVDVLLAAGRKTEAEPWLALLNKSSSDNSFDRRQLSELTKLTPQESIALNRYNELSNRIMAIGKEFNELREKQRRESLTVAEQRRYEELSQSLGGANASFQLFLKEFKTEFGEKGTDIYESRSLQSSLQRLGNGTVAIYTVVAENRCHIILVTPNIQVAYRTEIKAIELNRKVFLFRQALQNPSVDPRPLAKELYDILIKPIENDLNQFNAKTLMWSLDGTLRYIPIAALFDGQKYIVEKYATSLLTTHSMSSLLEASKSDWKVLALGTTKAMRVSIGGSEMNFAALPAVSSELAGIVKTGSATATSKGIFSGTILLDEAFTKSSMLKELQRDYNVVHLSTPFFLSENISNSFFVLGDGSVLTLEELQMSPAATFTGVELLVLSNSSVAFSSIDASGIEVEGFVNLAQRRGAKSVLESLWSAPDNSINILLQEFYRQRAASNPIFTKAEALRQAQLAILYGKPIKNDFRATSGNILISDDSKRPFAHPYFWSSFVLFGNWL
jgi:CHAT domain-containing protein